MSWYAYGVGPIDWNWVRLKTLKETLTDIVNSNELDSFTDQDDGVAVDEVRDFLSNWEAAKLLAAEKGWEGDFRVGPYVFWLPSETKNSFVYGFVFKQDNNGMTFVVSPEPLSWLKNWFE